jgi:putative lipoprotein
MDAGRSKYVPPRHKKPPLLLESLLSSRRKIGVGSEIRAKENLVKEAFSMSKIAAIALLAAPLCLTPVARAQSSASPSESTTHVFRGSVRYHQRIALPPDAVVRVIIEDVSQADGAPKSFAEENLPTKGRQIPIKFDVKYDPAAIDPTHRYQIRAKITSGGRLMFTSTNAYPVLTQGAPTDNVAIDLEQVSAQYSQHPSDSADHGQTALIDRQWTLAEVNGKTPENQTPQAYIKLNQKTQRVEGSGGCNRLMGSFQLEGRTLHFKEMGATMMACDGDVMNQERAFLAALNATESYRIHGTTLTLLGKDGKVLARLEAQETTTETQQ